MLLLVGMLLAGITGWTWAQDVSINAAVTTPPPAQAPAITAPVNGQHFTALPIDIRGTCQPGYIVEVYKNDVLAGEAVCDGSGRFAMKADLFIGSNTLIARLRDQINQQGPDSQPVNVSYEIVTGELNILGSGSAAAGSVFIKAEDTYKGTVPGQKLGWLVELLGGQPPYAFSVDWGDGKADLLSRNQGGRFTIEHIYDKAGGYKGAYIITLKVVDAAGTVGSLQLVAIVNNPVSAATTAAPSAGEASWWRYAVAWPLWVVALLMLVSFWLGERKQRRDDLAGGRPPMPVAGV